MELILTIILGFVVAGIGFLIAIGNDKVIEQELYGMKTSTSSSFTTL